jgi:DNA uptake protein ComE-like DNA-binding protein
MKKLGLTEKQAKNVLTYREHGGKFFEKEDFKKIYSIRFKQYQILEPYIDIKNKKASTEISENEKPAQTFPFNPNTIPADSMQMLGFSEQMAKRVINYREKVKPFQQKSDFKKVYGMDSVQYKHIEPFIQLPDEFKAQKHIYDINLIEAKTLIKEVGVDPKFAYRIINYRKKLGGFYSKNQIKEVFEMDSLKADSIIAEIIINNPELVKLNINDKSDILLKHPYINKKNIFRIEQYKMQHKQFSSLEEIEGSGVFLPEEFQKIKNYLDVK